jgi:hypothetical protein
VNIPIETKPALLGFAAGAAAMAIAGFAWGGWVTGSSAETASLARANAAVVSALAPVCVENFQRAGDATGNLSALKKVGTWSRGEFIEKGGWATIAGAKGASEQVSAVAKACAQLLVPA